MWGWCRSCFPFIFLYLIAAGCKEQSGTTTPIETPNILEVIQSNSNLTIFKELLDGTTLSSTLSGPGMKTVFAPSNDALAKLDPNYLQGLTNQHKLDILKYHIHNANYLINNEIKREAIGTLQGDLLFIEIGQSFGNLLNNQARFVTTNIKASNGLIHIIDVVLVPDQHGTLADNIKKRYDYRTFHERMNSSGLLGDLNEPGNKTLLTASEAAMDLMTNGLGMILTDENWKEIMQYHILDQDITVAGPGTKTALLTMSGDSVFLTVDEPGQYVINGAHGAFIETINATNGKIINSNMMMLPDKFIGVLTVLDKRFYVQTARAALAVAKMTGRLYNATGNGDEKSTIFIPGNDADGLNTLPTEESELANILKYHVLLEEVRLDQLQHNQTYITWQGEQITITKNGDQITINETTTIKQSNLVGKNGVAHVIDRVLTPAPSN